MPNGGSDCCANCWFNTGARELYRPSNRSDIHYCEIREFPIENRAYTYCANNPKVSRERDPLPVGPAFILASYDMPRQVLIESPDTEDIRQNLLKLVGEIQPENAERPIYLASHYTIEDIVIYQLGLFREGRAETDLCRIADFDFEPRDPASSQRVSRLEFLTMIAKWALSVLDAPPESAVGRKWLDVLEPNT